MRGLGYRLVEVAIATPILYERSPPPAPLPRRSPLLCAAACWLGTLGWVLLTIDCGLGSCAIYSKAISRRNCKTNCSCNSTN